MILSRTDGTGNERGKSDSALCQRRGLERGVGRGHRSPVPGGIRGDHTGLEDRLGDMEDSRPNDPISKEYTDWADAYEGLKDLISKVKDRLDGLG